MHALQGQCPRMIEALAGRPAWQVRDELNMFAWDLCWPVIDRDGKLTGAIYETSGDHETVDCENGVITPGNDFAIDIADYEALFGG